jgi:predicted ester cyclase
MATVQSTDDIAIRHYEEVVGAFRQKAFIERQFDAIEEYLTKDFVDHFAPPWDLPGWAGVRHRFRQAAEAFHTTKVVILHSMRKGEILMQAIEIHLKHTGEFMGLPASGQDVMIGGFDAFEIRDGKIAAHWGVYDVSRIPDLLSLAPGDGTHNRQVSWASMWGE